MMRVVSFSERTSQVAPPKIITVAAATATILLDNEKKSRGEIAARYIQNVGNEDLYYSFDVENGALGPSCNATDTFHGILATKQQLDCSAMRGMVSGYSPNGTTVSTTIIRRGDMTHRN